MNECDPIDDENYVWGLGDAVAAIWEESPGRVIVADVHTPNSAVTEEIMAALGCALSCHFYNLRDISVVSAEKEAASGFEISCPEGSCFTMSGISLTLSNGNELPFTLVFDYWQGTELAEITVSEDGSYTSTLSSAHLKQNGQSLADLVAIGEKCGDPMAFGISQDAIEKLFMDQIETFQKLGLAWCFEYGGRYALATPAPYLEGIEYRDLENSPHYIIYQSGNGRVFQTDFGQIK